MTTHTTRITTINTFKQPITITTQRTSWKTNQTKRTSNTKPTEPAPSSSTENFSSTSTSANSVTNSSITTVSSTTSPSEGTNIGYSRSTETPNTPTNPLSPWLGLLGIAIVPILIIILICVLIRNRRRTRPGEEPSIEEGLEVQESTVIPVDQLPKFLKALDKEVVIYSQFESIPKVAPDSDIIKTAKRNKSKDMYANIIPYDHNCVQLQPIPGQSKSTYINASYIDSYDRPKAFIACTGPRDTSLSDFWRMIWEHSIDFIFMLTLIREKSKKKCERYWPEVVGDTCQYGELQVTFQKEKQLLDYPVRYLSVKKQNECERTVIQYQFIAWADKNVPENSLGVLNIRNQLRRSLQATASPIILHCSAGVGRTGSLLAIDYLLEQAMAERLIDVPHCVMTLRTQRMRMVQTPDQFMFVYEAVADGILLGSTCIPFSQFLSTYRKLKEPKADGTTCLQNQFSLLTKTYFKEDRSSRLQRTMSNISRIPDVVRNRISSYISIKETEQTIDVVYVKSYSLYPTYLATSAPQADTLVNFWQTIWDNGCRSVVMLCPSSDVDVSALYCPEEETDTFMAHPFGVECLSKKKSGHHVVKKLQITNRGSREVTHHSMDCSMSSLKNKEMVELFTNIYEETIVKQRDSGRTPVFVHCVDGIEWTGLYCAFSCLLDQINSDKEIDVFNVVRLIRTSRSRFINSGQYNQLIELLYIYVMDNI